MSASAKAICVDPKKVDLIWPEVSYWIKRAMERGDLGTFDRVEDDVLNGHALLWLALVWPDIEGVAVTQIGRTEKSKVCTIIACGGRHMSRWLSAIAPIEQYAREQGCDVVRILGRKGWLRALKDYRAPKVVLEKKL